jgi:hypothetical protein
MTTKQNDLSGFNWEEDKDDFFGTSLTPEKEVEDLEKDLDKDEDEEEVVIPKKGVKKIEDEEEASDFFGDSIKKNIEDEEENEEDFTPKNNTTSIYKDLILDSKEQGLFKHIDISEEEDIDVDRFAELQEEEYETEVSARLKSWATEELDEDARAFIKFKREGGKTEDFFSAYATNSEIPQGDISNEDYQDKVIRFQLTEDGWDAEEIEDRLAYLTENGKKEKTAKKYDERFKEYKEQEKQELLEQAEVQNKQIKIQEESFKTNIKTFLDSKDEVEGFKIAQPEKVKLLNFLTKKDQKVGEGRVITGFQKKLSEVFQDTDKMILLAKLISTDFDMSDFEKKTITKKTREIKSKLEQRQNLRPASSGSSFGGTKSLAEFF